MASATSDDGPRRATLPALAVTFRGTLGSALRRTQWAGPEASGQQVERLRHRPCQLSSLVYGLGQQGQRLVPGASLDFVDAVHGMQIERVCRQAVKGIGWHSQDHAGLNFLSGVGYQGCFRISRADSYDFGTQPNLFECR